MGPPGLLSSFRTLRTKLTPSPNIQHTFRIFTLCIRTALVTHLISTYGYNLSPTQGPSMLPTLSVYGDYVLISRLYRRGRDIKVGDVVSFDSVVEPGRVIKRVLGMPGDYVLRGTPGKGGAMIQVPEGHCWVVGDNLPDSRDSRYFGPMPLALIKGKVIAKVFPWSERCWFDDGLQPVQDS